MRHINGVYTLAFNRRHGKVGHLFQGRFKAILADREAYLLEVCRYVELNPVRASMVATPAECSGARYRVAGWAARSCGATCREYPLTLTRSVCRPSRPTRNWRPTGRA